VNPEHVLVTAFFVGWEATVPLLIWQKVYLDETEAHGVAIREQVLPLRELPYTSNAVTQDIIEGNSPSAVSMRNQWKASSLLVPDRELDWRQMEFFVFATSKYDPTVSPIANVLEIRVGSKANWLHNPSCQS
jgi:hypothetical protein